MNERARTCAHIECDHDLYMSLSVHTQSRSFLYVYIACFCIGKKGGVSSDDDNDDGDDVIIA